MSARDEDAASAPTLREQEDAECDAFAAADKQMRDAAGDLLDALQYVMSAHGEQLHDAFDQAHRAIIKATGAAP